MDTQLETDIYLEKISALFNRVRNPKIVAGVYLLEIKKKKEYMFLDHGYSNWNEFLKSDRIKMPYTTAHRYLKIAEKYVEECGLTVEDLESHDTWSLTYIANKVTKENVKEWLEFIKNHSRQEVINKVKNNESKDNREEVLLP